MGFSEKGEWMRERRRETLSGQRETHSLYSEITCGLGTSLGPEDGERAPLPLEVGHRPDDL